MALVRLAFETEQGDGQPPAAPAAGRQGRRCWPARPSWPSTPSGWAEVADAIAGEDPLPPPLRVFQRLYEVAPPESRPSAAARTTSGSSAWPPPPATAPPSRPGRNSTPGAWTPERALRLGLGALDRPGVSDLDRKGERSTLGHPRSRSPARYPEAEPLPDRPELDDLLREAGLDVTWDATTTTYRRPDESPLATSGSSRLLTAGSGSSHGSRRPRKAVTPEEAERPPVRRAAAVRAARRGVPRPDRPAQGDDRLRAGECCGGSRTRAGLVRPAAAEAPAGEGRRAGGRLAGRRARPTVPRRLRRTGEPVRPGRAGRSRPSRPNCRRPRRPSCWSTRAYSRGMLRWTMLERLRDQVGRQGGLPRDVGAGGRRRAERAARDRRPRGPPDPSGQRARVPEPWLDENRTDAADGGRR